MDTRLNAGDDKYMGIIRGRSKGIAPIRKGDCGIRKGETRLTNSPTPIEGVNKFVYKEDCNYPSSPTSDVRGRAKSPILPRPGDTRSNGIWKFGDSERQKREG